MNKILDVKGVKNLSRKQQSNVIGGGPDWEVCYTFWTIAGTFTYCEDHSPD